jgi:hypothetical protein
MGMTLVETIDVGATAVSQIEFTSIPQTGHDLLILLSGKSSYAQVHGDFSFLINNVTTANYDWYDLMVYATTIYAQKGDTVSELPPDLYSISGSTTATTNIWGSASLYFYDYTSSRNKLVNVESGFSQTSTSSTLGIFGGKQTTTDPITSIQLRNRAGYNFVQHSTASLYTIS